MKIHEPLETRRLSRAPFGFASKNFATDLTRYIKLGFGRTQNDDFRDDAAWASTAPFGSSITTIGRYLAIEAEG